MPVTGWAVVDDDDVYYVNITTRHSPAAEWAVVDDDCTIMMLMSTAAEVYYFDNYIVDQRCWPPWQASHPCCVARPPGDSATHNVAAYLAMIYTYIYI